MQLKIEVVLDDSTQQGFDAYDLIKEACAEYGAKMRVFQFLPDHDPPPPSGRRRGDKPPAGYPVAWRNCTEMVRALCDRFNGGVVLGGWDARFRRGVANADKAPASLRRIIKPLGLLQQDGYAYPWWRVSRDFTLLPPPPEAR